MDQSSYHFNNVDHDLMFDLDGVRGSSEEELSRMFLANDAVLYQDVNVQVAVHSDLSLSTSPDFVLQHPQSLPIYVSDEAGLAQPWGDLSSRREPVRHSVSEGMRSFSTSPHDFAYYGFQSPQASPNYTFALADTLRFSPSSPLAIPSNVSYNDHFGYLSPTETNDTFNFSQQGWQNSFDSASSFPMSRTTSVTESIASFDGAGDDTLQLSSVPEEPTESQMEAAQEPAEVLGTSPFNIIQMRARSGSNQLAPAATSNARKPRGRTGPLTEAKRRRTAMMRKLGACASCRERKAPCDPGAPCQQCIQYHKEKLVLSPCRGKRLADIADELLRGHIFPRPRDLAKDFGREYQIWGDREFTVYLSLGFGRPLPWTAKVVAPHGSGKFAKELTHEHVVYNWPADHSYPTKREKQRHYVFPAMLTNVAQLRGAIDRHLDALIDDRENFHNFPLYNSPLVVLTHIWDFYLKLGDKEEEHQAKLLLRQAFKLLNLIHVGGDTRITSSSDSRRILNHFFGPYMHEHQTIPCVIRGQVGEIYKSLALEYMREVLSNLEIECLRKNCRRFPLVVGTFMVLLMGVESIQYHTHKDTFHYDYEGSAGLTEDKIDGMAGLLEFYNNTFGQCHWERILSASEFDRSWGAGASGSTFAHGEQLLAQLREAVRSSKRYLVRRSKESLSSNGGDIAVFFDRLVARLLLLEAETARFG